MHQLAKRNGWKLPQTPEGYGFLSYEAEPLPTKHLSSAEVLAFFAEYLGLDPSTHVGVPPGTVPSTNPARPRGE